MLWFNQRTHPAIAYHMRTGADGGPALVPVKMYQVEDKGDKHERRKRVKRRKRNQRTLQGLRREAESLGVVAPANVGTLPEVLDEVLRRAVGYFRFAASMVDDLDPDHMYTESLDAQGNRVYKPHWYIEAERAAREEVADLALRMSGLDIDARRVAIAEAQAVLMTRALQSAIESIGLTADQRKLLGPALRNARAMLTGTSDPEALEGTATPPAQDGLVSAGTWDPAEDEEAA